MQPDIATYLAARDAQRAASVAALYEGLTERERLLVHDAAVMGFVRGNMHERGDIPNDRDVVVEVIDACISMPDLYPTLTGHTP